MTREEAIKLLRKMRETIDRNNKYGEAEEMGIQALEQEPKTGHWILRKSFAGMDDCECDICNQLTTTLRGNRMNYCPNCGCRMVEPNTDNDLDMKLKLMEANVNGYTQGLKDASNTDKGEQPKIIKCPNCGNVQFADKEWCPDCGAKMVDPQESEVENKEKLSWLGKNCKDCGNEKCKKLGTLPKGYDCALWQAESENKE